MPRAYTATLDANATTEALDLIQILAPSDGVVELDKVSVSQETATASAVGSVQISFTTTASTGASITATPIDKGDAAFGGTVTGVTTCASTEESILYREGWNVLAPWIWHPTPEERTVLTPGEGVVVRLDVYPGSTMNVSAVVAFREIGG
jgi:hypothetical protein